MTDQDRDRSTSEDSIDGTMQVIKEIVEKSADGDYLYRGEPKCYPLVSSSLYRRMKCKGLDHLDIERAQDEILLTAREFAGQDYEDEELLTQLQHYGSVTNLIDFTTDYLVALFFACDQKPNKDGRVHLLRRANNLLLLPKTPENRVVAQKSTFVRPPKGFVKPDKTVFIPYVYKEEILNYLNECHGLRASTIYNDLHGFIRYHQGHESAYLVFYSALDQAKKCEYEPAIEGFNRAINLKPQLTPAYNNRGNVYKDMREYDRAIEDFDEAIKLNPKLAAAYSNRGVVFARKDRYDNAFQDYNRAIEIDPSYAEAYYNRGNAYSEKCKYGCAIQDYDKAIELGYAAAYTNRGIAYMQKGDLDRAIQDLTSAIGLNPNNAVAYTNRGVAYGLKKEFDNAIQNYDMAIKLDPRHTAAYTNRGIAFMQKDEHDRALQDFDKATKLTPSFAIAYYNRSLCWLVLNEWAKAKADLSKTQKLGEDIASAFRREFGSVAAFEERYSVKLPSEIAAILMPRGEE